MTQIRYLHPKPVWSGQIRNSPWIALTSGAGVRALPQILGDLRKLAGKKIAVVGRSTASILQSIGLKADYVGPGPGAEALAQAWPGKRKESVLHITGSSEDGKLVRILRKKGFRAGRIEVYQNMQPVRPSKVIFNALQKEGADWVVFASGTAAERFRRLASRWTHEPKVAVIGPATARVAKAKGWNVRVIAKTPSAESALAAVLSGSARKRKLAV
jgi:uroporphyrinogen-III synthase